MKEILFLVLFTVAAAQCPAADFSSVRKEALRQVLREKHTSHMIGATCAVSDGNMGMHSIVSVDESGISCRSGKNGPSLPILAHDSLEGTVFAILTVVDKRRLVFMPAVAQASTSLADLELSGALVAEGEIAGVAMEIQKELRRAAEEKSVQDLINREKWQLRKF